MPLLLLLKNEPAFAEAGLGLGGGGFMGLAIKTACLSIFFVVIGCATTVRMPLADVPGSWQQCALTPSSLGYLKRSLLLTGDGQLQWNLGYFADENCSKSTGVTLQKMFKYEVKAGEYADSGLLVLQNDLGHSRQYPIRVINGYLYLAEDWLATEEYFFVKKPPHFKAIDYNRPFRRQFAH